jgi:hypothetical protein
MTLIEQLESMANIYRVLSTKDVNGTTTDLISGYEDPMKDIRLAMARTAKLINAELPTTTD